ncbi:MAG: helix-hairpin-helix domain-containing protein [Elusimicrobiota bacterium]|nr:helix-hairpin-helix domain-containing protein [Elusimicrobiota bacterium]
MKKLILMTACALALTFPSEIAAKSKKAAKKTAKASFEKINLNEVNAYDLKKIPGISSRKAKAIINYREEKGKIKSIDDLKEINHETRSGKTSYDFATSKGRWRKAMRILVEGEVFTLKDGASVVDQNALYRHLFPEPADINKSTVKELSALPGISKRKAQRIVSNRPFSSLSGLKDISHETKSGRTSYDFATSKGAWRKAMRILVKSDRLVCSGSKKGSKKK